MSTNAPALTPGITPDAVPFYGPGQQHAPSSTTEVASNALPPGLVPDSIPYHSPGRQYADSPAPVADNNIDASATQPSTTPQPSSTPSVGTRTWQATKDELGNVVIQGVVAPVKSAVNAVVQPPTDPREHAIASKYGPDALVAYRAARGVSDAAENWFKSKGENARQAAVDMANAVREFHEGNYRNALADTASVAAGAMGLSGTQPGVEAGRVRDIVQGTKPGGDMVTPITKDVVDLGAALAAEKAPEVARGVGKTASRVADAAGELRPQFEKPVEPPKPVAQHVSVATPLDDATIRKSFDKNLSSEARETLRDHVGDTISAGSSVENTLLKAVAPVNDTITQQGLKLNQLLQDAGPLKTTAGEKISNAITNLKSDLPGGTEETFGKAIDKELARAKDVMQSQDPLAVNDYIRELDKRIDSYNAPEEPIDTSSQAADAARVTIRRILRDKINTEVAGTKPINDVLGKNLEVRNALRKKFGDVAYDPVAAEAQHASELKKGQSYLDYEKTMADYQKTWQRAKAALYAVGAGTLIHQIEKFL